MDAARNTTPSRYGESVRKAKGGGPDGADSLLPWPPGYLVWNQLLRPEGNTFEIARKR
jgi:hypothetical protein